MEEVVGLATILAAVLGIFTVFQWRLSKRQLKLDVMTKVHERYSQLYRTLAQLPQDLSSYDELNPDEKEAISAYINLCAEQFHWRASERIIDDMVWKVWETAIVDKLRHPAIKLAWNANHRHDVYYDGFNEFAEHHIGTP